LCMHVCMYTLMHACLLVFAVFICVYVNTQLVWADYKMGFLQLITLQEMNQGMHVNKLLVLGCT